MKRGNVRIGVSGWRYEPWRGAFYPPGLRQEDELAYAAERLPTIELNGSFYSLQTPESYADWYRATPEGFVFSVKAGRYITHLRRLKDVAKPIANFFASGLFNLKEKLGPILWQFPPNMKFDPGRFEEFMALLPHDTSAALALARKRDARMTGRAALKVDAQRPVRHAIEIRHPSFLEPGFIALLRRYGIALVIADTGDRWPQPHDVTADFVYMRLHGATELYTSRYSEETLQSWAERIEAWAAGSQPAGVDLVAPATVAPRAARDVYCYFDNTDKLHAPDNARRLMELMSVAWSPLRRVTPKTSGAPAVRRAA
jgi:uncharacterized protein YecE (DUF72 family)